MNTDRFDLVAERAKRHHEGIAATQRQLAVLPASRLATNLARAQGAAIDRLRDDQNPTFPIPNALLAGPVGLAIEQRAGRRVGVSMRDFCGHTIALGSTGCGKTSGIAHITNNIAQHDPSVKTSYFDPKGDWRKRALDDPRCVIINPTLPLNILRPPSFMHPEAYRALLVETFGRSHWVGYQQLRVLQAATKSALARSPDPSIEDLVAELRPLMGRDRTYTERDAAGGIEYKLTEFQRLLPGVYTAKGRCITMEDLVKVPAYWPMVPGDTYEFLFTLWLQVLFHHNEANNIRDTLDSAVVIDESLRIFSAQTHHMEGSPLLERAISTVREVGIGLFFTTTSWRSLTPVVRANTNIQLAMLTTDGGEADDLRRTFQLTVPEFFAYQRLHPLECLLRMPSQWPHPILASVPPFLQQDKLAPANEWAAAIRDRQAALLPPPPLPLTIATAPPPPVLTTIPSPPATMPQYAAPTTRMATPTPPSGAQPTLFSPGIIKPVRTPAAPVTTVPNAADPPTPEVPGVPPVEPVRLTIPEEVLLRWLCQAGIATVTETYAGAKLPIQVGDRAVKKLEGLGFLTREPIIVRPGRGGKAVALTPAARAYTRLGLKPLHRTRGGDSAQHYYLVTHLARCIPGAMIETTLGGVGGKSIDIVFPRTQEHDRFLHVVASHARTLSMTRAVLAPNDLVAIEVEVSDPTQTVHRNATGDLAAGVALVVFATMPKAVDAAMRTLMTFVPAAQHPRLVVVDALQLLESLQGDNL